MREIPPPSPAVVVGIDGSRGAVDTALWAIDEAVERDLPLRLVYAIADRDRGAVDAQNIAHDFATGEAAVRYAAMAIESVDKPVKIEVEIVQGRPATALLSASRDAAMLCVGALGVDRATGKRVGSTVTELLARAHCPVAIVRPNRLNTREPGWIVTEFDESPDGSTVLGLALDEARMRQRAASGVGHVATTLHGHLRRPCLCGRHQAGKGQSRALVDQVPPALSGPRHQGSRNAR